LIGTRFETEEETAKMTRRQREEVNKDKYVPIYKQEVSVYSSQIMLKLFFAISFRSQIRLNHSVQSQTLVTQYTNILSSLKMRKVAKCFRKVPLKEDELPVSITPWEVLKVTLLTLITNNTNETKIIIVIIVAKAVV
jgi:hypothetical protein